MTEKFLPMRLILGIGRPKLGCELGMCTLGQGKAEAGLLSVQGSRLLECRARGYSTPPSIHTGIQGSCLFASLVFVELSFLKVKWRH